MSEYFSFLQFFTVEQFEQTAFRNIFHQGRETVAFDLGTVEAIKSYRLNRIQLDPSERELWLDDCVLSLYQRFSQTNQHMHFSPDDLQLIRGLYSRLLTEIETPGYPIESIERNHYDRIRALVRHISPTLFQLNGEEAPYARRMVSQVYPPDFLLRLLGIQLDRILEPILDIGCGKEASLVLHLREQELEAYGIDRDHPQDEVVIEEDFLTFHYGMEMWGTVISNLSFSSHFLSHHEADDGTNLIFADAYRGILAGLKPGGRFVYAPSLPFMEEVLDGESYRITHRSITKEYGSTMVEKR